MLQALVCCNAQVTGHGQATGSIPAAVTSLRPRFFPANLARTFKPSLRYALMVKFNNFSI